MEEKWTEPQRLVGPHRCNGCLRREEGRGTTIIFENNGWKLSRFVKKIYVHSQKGPWTPSMVNTVTSESNWCKPQKKNLERQQETNSLHRGGASVLRVLTAHQWKPEGSRTVYACCWEETCPPGSGWPAKAFHTGEGNKDSQANIGGGLHC